MDLESLVFESDELDPDESEDLKQKINEDFIGSKDTIWIIPLMQKVYVREETIEKEINLTPTEYNILNYLVTNSGRAISYDELSSNVWNSEEGASNSLIVHHFLNLRKKLGQKNAAYIELIWGYGVRCSVSNLNEPKTEKKYSFGDFTLDIISHRLDRNGETIPLTPIEYDILRVLAEKPGVVLSKEQLAMSINLLRSTDSEYIDLKPHMHSLRKKLDDNILNPRYIKTVYGRGYKFIGK